MLGLFFFSFLIHADLDVATMLALLKVQLANYFPYALFVPWFLLFSPPLHEYGNMVTEAQRDMDPASRRVLLP
jgi:hypothetical protein